MYLGKFLKLDHDVWLFFDFSRKNYSIKRHYFVIKRKTIQKHVLTLTFFDEVLFKFEKDVPKRRNSRLNRFPIGSIDSCFDANIVCLELNLTMPYVNSVY